MGVITIVAAVCVYAAGYLPAAWACARLVGGSRAGGWKTDLREAEDAVQDIISYPTSHDVKQVALRARARIRTSRNDNEQTISALVIVTWPVSFMYLVFLIAQRLPGLFIKEPKAPADDSVKDGSYR